MPGCHPCQYTGSSSRSRISVNRVPQYPSLPRCQKSARSDLSSMSAYFTRMLWPRWGSALVLIALYFKICPFFAQHLARIAWLKVLQIRRKHFHMLPVLKTLIFWFVNGRYISLQHELIFPWKFTTVSGDRLFPALSFVLCCSRSASLRRWPWMSVFNYVSRQQ